MGDYSLGDLLTLLKNPTSMVGVIRAMGLGVNRFYHDRFVENDGMKVVDADWDNLIILDGCRFDLFERVNEIEGRLRPVTSRGSTSTEFLLENFADEVLHDTVYVSANPYMHKLDGDVFYRIYDLTRDDWDEEEETVLPAQVVERSLEAHQNHPDKRLIIHFMQPHYPFIGELGKRIAHRGYRNKRYHDDDHRAKYTVWGKLQYNLEGLTEETVWEAYRENLEIVLEHVERLVEDLDGKTVITSDHGNLVGDRLWPVPVKGYAHPGGLRLGPLTTVPWLEPDFDSRRDTVSQPPPDATAPVEIDEAKLEALGYVS